jgi:hypothetical protein
VTSFAVLERELMNFSNIKISTSISTQPTSHKLFAKRRPKSMEDESNDISLEAGAEITQRLEQA